jgi:hypothetical protein
MWSLGLIVMEMLYAFLFGKPKRIWKTPTFNEFSGKDWQYATLTKIMKLKGEDETFWRQCFTKNLIFCE